MITRMLLASVLAIGAGSFAGCGDDAADCPGTVAAGASCTTSGLACYAGSKLCVCTSHVWDCGLPVDMRVPDLSLRDMTPATD